MSDEQLFAGELDPAAGKLGATARTNEQSTDPGSRVVEFGAGCGHLSLLLASLRPDCLFTLVEVKPYTSNIAAGRVASSGLANAAVFTGSIDDIDEYASSAACFDVAIGLHLCGLLTDAWLALAGAPHPRIEGDTIYW
ncbi:hypothetical protein EMIHUDRAFT_246751 [Emiliania huxleyi CCMP1516]|uniref:Methyltransferase domain-containing protein n=2 Tax=Emiliania huxleyi TaxID=2903 RepID=A0A0D3IQW5_EMIH1|nr:hypothetical protein EMIHUDRAFT_246751 [Emiliania huxleyi CCMP1516]EOD13650.1 hypothetical protein EMIHUDRAFT_246751 [Emiliania huxleyi CCMP1516]|eukprot:XP_005766079.1 hypothetical protein EMIHUDRAFT_246751 [Emiliania huxleyi CCMP1516]